MQMRSQSFSITTYLKFLLRTYIDLAYYLFVFIATICIFIFDLISSLDVVAGTPYVLLVFGSLWIRGNTGTYIIAVMGLLFTLIGLYFSPAIVISMDTILINRALTVLLIILTAIMVLKIKKANADISNLIVQTPTDPLTHCKNKRAFEQELESEILRDKRYNRSLSIAIIDIDNLKEINDTYGYDRGDYLIKMIAEEIGSNIRKSDVLYRLEDDKFAILFAETDMKEAKRAGDAICKKIANNLEVKENKVTISIGIATLGAADCQKKLCKRAEEALSISKSNGKNQVSTLPYIVVSKDKSRIAAILSRSRPTSPR